jgi:hypothetical protein
MVLLARFDLIEFDFDHEMLLSVSAVLDAHLLKLAEYGRDADADSWDLLHDRDNTLGLGFTAAQTYLTSVSRALGMKRNVAIGVGDKCVHEYTFALIVNSAANCWKHQDEWDHEMRNTRRDNTIQVLASAGVDATAEYPLSSLLSNLRLANLTEVAQALIQWRNELWKRRHDEELLAPHKDSRAE